jgi:hypothetical protein
MIGVRSLVGVTLAANPPREAAPPAVRDLVMRLRNAADRMVAFSVTKTLLRDAAATIEQLEGRLEGQKH